MTVATLADGASYIRETIFDGRYTLVPELNKMGAKVEIDNNVAIVHGPTSLRGCDVVAHDLRGGAALILAGLAAEGETVVSQRLPHRPRARDVRRATARPRRRRHGRRARDRLAPGQLPAASATYPLTPGRGRRALPPGSASFAAGVPIEILAPSPGNARTAMPTASQASAKARRLVAQPEPDEVRLGRGHGPAIGDEGPADPVALLHHRLHPLEELVLGVEGGDRRGLGDRAHA